MIEDQGFRVGERDWRGSGRAGPPGAGGIGQRLRTGGSTAALANSEPVLEQIRLGNLANHPGGHTHHDRARLDIAGDHRTGGHVGLLADDHARGQNRAGPHSAGAAEHRAGQA
jgi:hypothetical protein